MPVSKKVKVRIDIDAGFLDYEGDPESTSSVFSEAAMVFGTKSGNLRLDPKMVGFGLLTMVAISVTVNSMMNRPQICSVQESGYEQPR